MSASAPPEWHLMDQTLGYFYSAALRAAARLGVADQLADSARTPEELAEKVGADGPSLHRLLRLLATRDVFSEDATGRFHLTASAQLLRTDVPGSMRSAVLMLTEQFFWEPAELLDDAVRQGVTQFGRVFPAPFFDWLAQDEQAGETFHVGMAAHSDAENPEVVDNYDFSRIGTLVDVGGGYGGLLVEVLRNWPNVHGVLFDEEHVLAGNRLGEAGLTDRSETVSGDFFDEVPSGADAYVLKRILHDWDDDNSVRVLSRCREAMPAHGRVLVVDTVIPADNEPHLGKYLDVLLMTSLTGKERTAAEIDEVLRAAGLSRTRVIPTSTPVSIVEAVVA